MNKERFSLHSHRHNYIQIDDKTEEENFKQVLEKKNNKLINSHDNGNVIINFNNTNLNDSAINLLKPNYSLLLSLPKQNLENQINKNITFNEPKENLENKPSFLVHKSSSKENLNKKVTSKNYLIELKRKIRKASKVYDSISEDEDEYILNKFAVNPNSNTKFIVDFLVFCVGFYSIIYLPIRLIFFKYASIMTILIELFFDIIFIFDILIGFFTSYYDFEENYIGNIKSTALHYLETSFTSDLIAGIPFNTFSEIQLYSLEDNIIRNLKKLNLVSFSNSSDFDIYSGHGNLINDVLSFYGNADSVYDLLLLNFKDYQRLLKLCRLFKIIKMFSNNKFFDWFKEKIVCEALFKSSYSKIIFYYLFFLNICHILTCIFIFLGTLDYPNWIISANLKNEPIEIIYISALYFNLTTIFSIGYGDITTRNIYERLYNNFLMIIGVMLYSFALTSISHTIKIQNESKKDYDNKKAYLDNLNVKYSIYKINSNLYYKISRHLDYENNYNKINKNKLLLEIPISLRNKLILSMYDDVINSFNFFKNTNGDIDFIIQAILILKPTISTKNDVLIKQGDFIEEILFVKKGVLQLETILGSNNILNGEENPSIKLKTVTKENEKSAVYKILRLRQNEHFGDALMIDNVRSPITVITKSQMAEIYLMDKFNAMSLSDDYSEIFEDIYLKSSINMARIARIINKAYLLKMQYDCENIENIMLEHRDKFNTNEDSKINDIKINNQTSNNNVNDKVTNNNQILVNNDFIFNINLLGDKERKEGIINNKNNILDNSINANKKVFKEEHKEKTLKHTSSKQVEDYILKDFNDNYKMFGNSEIFGSDIKDKIRTNEEEKNFTNHENENTINEFNYNQVKNTKTHESLYRSSDNLKLRISTSHAKFKDLSNNLKEDLSSKFKILNTLKISEEESTQILHNKLISFQNSKTKIVSDQENKNAFNNLPQPTQQSTLTSKNSKSRKTLAKVSSQLKSIQGSKIKKVKKHSEMHIKNKKTNNSQKESSNSSSIENFNSLKNLSFNNSPPLNKKHFYEECENKFERNSKVSSDRYSYFSNFSVPEEDKFNQKNKNRINLININSSRFKTFEEDLISRVLYLEKNNIKDYSLKFLSIDKKKDTTNNTCENKFLPTHINFSSIKNNIQLDNDKLSFFKIKENSIKEDMFDSEHLKSICWICKRSLVSSESELLIENTCTMNIIASTTVSSSENEKNNFLKPMYPSNLKNLNHSLKSNEVSTQKYHLKKIDLKYIDSNKTGCITPDNKRSKRDSFYIGINEDIDSVDNNYFIIKNTLKEKDKSTNLRGEYETLNSQIDTLSCVKIPKDKQSTKINFDLDVNKSTTIRKNGSNASIQNKYFVDSSDLKKLNGEFNFEKMNNDIVMNMKRMNTNIFDQLNDLKMTQNKSFQNNISSNYSTSQLSSNKKNFNGNFLNFNIINISNNNVLEESQFFKKNKRKNFKKSPTMKTSHYEIIKKSKSSLPLLDDCVFKRNFHKSSNVSNNKKDLKNRSLKIISSPKFKNKEKEIFLKSDKFIKFKRQNQSLSKKEMPYIFTELIKKKKINKLIVDEKNILKKLDKILNLIK